MRLLTVACLVASWRLATPCPLLAQDASPYVPLQHWAMPFVEHLIAVGAIADPTPLTRPLREGELARALRALDTTTVTPAVRATVRQLLAELERDASAGRPRYRVTGDAGVAIATHALRDPLELGRGQPPRTAGADRGFASGGLALELRLGPVIAVTHPYFDTRLKYDPDWFGKKDRLVAGRVAEAYVGAHWKFAELFFGLLDRNWGPAGVQGIMLSDNPYDLDHLGVALGTSNTQIQGIATQLDDRTDSTGATVHRYLAQHRIWIRPGGARGRWTFALWEASVLSGAGRQFEPWYLNIMNLGFLQQLNTGTNANTFVGLDFERRAAATLFGQFMLDDIQVDKKTLSDRKPTSYALTLGARGRVHGASLGWTAFYTRVANLAYRNEDNLQVPLYHRLGTGRNFNDYDQTTAKLSLLPQPGLLLQPELTLLRQGQGDLRLPHPPVASYDTTAAIFAGVVERTIRLALGASWQRGAWGLRGDGGVHFLHNAGHVTGASDTRWVGSLSLSYRFHLEGEVP
jgi:hypothetical protein